MKDSPRQTRIEERIEHCTEANGQNLPDFNSMTDEQIKYFIIQDHPDVPLTPADIKITRNGGEINISIINQAGIKMKMRVK
ncbi:hypothetical protein [Adhaeribacter radiodurans]|uniref:Uncharacterized protein n=1 Tax=Adhaeribacter radiodurans TaxID=2745197 RepID=A0A7L7LA74_9BACT|nr:hypothetical protein [Adhaeribacter radiodurans]QMU29637.1 hypothetical protein HUW48_17075 [Adhaeribacter radiodurans]